MNDNKDEKRHSFDSYQEFIDYHTRFKARLEKFRGEKSIKSENGQRSRIDSNKQLDSARDYVKLLLPLLTRFPLLEEMALKTYIECIESDLKEPLAFNRTCQPVNLHVEGRPLFCSAIALDRCRKELSLEEKNVFFDNKKGCYLGEISMLEGVKVKLNALKTICTVSCNGKEIELDIGNHKLSSIFPLSDIEKKLYAPSNNEDMFVKEIGCAQSLPSLYKQRAYGENYPYNLYKHLYEYLAVVLSDEKLLSPTRIHLLILIGLFITGPFLSTCTIRNEHVSISSSMAVWLSGAPGAVNPIFAKLLDQTKKERCDRYLDVAQGFIINSIEDSPSKNKHNKLYKFLDLGKKVHVEEASSNYSMKKLRFTRMQAQERAVKNMNARVAQNNAKGEEKAEIVLTPDSSYFLLPEVLGDIDIPSMYAPAGWMKRVSYAFNELLVFQECEDDTFEEIRNDFISKLIIGGYAWYEKNKGVGTNLLKYLQAYTSIHPVLVGLDDTENYFNNNVEYRHMTDLPALTSMLPLFNLENEKFSSAEGLEAAIAKAVKKECDDVSSKLFDYGVGLQGRIGKSSTHAEAQNIQNYLLCFCNWINRFASVGYGHADKLTAMGIFMTPTAIRTKEKADPNSPIFEKQLFNALMDVPPDPDFSPIKSQLELMKQTSAGPGYSVKVTADDGFEIADFTASSLASVSTNKKPGVAMAAAASINDSSLEELVGGPLAPYGSGRRDDTTKSVRIIYVMNFTALDTQAQTTAALGVYEKDGVNKHVYANANSKGDIPNAVNMFKIAVGCASTAPYTSSLNIPYSKSQPFNTEIPLAVGSKRVGGSAIEVMGAEDYPKWDQHVRVALRALYKHAAAGTGPFEKSTLQERVKFMHVYKRFIDGLAIFIIQEGDSDSFFILVSSLTSGDSWTTKLNSFVHDELQKFLKRIFQAYADAPTDGTDSWAKPFMNPDVNYIKAPLNDVKLIVTIDDAYRRVFGDDGLLKQIISGLRLKSPMDQILAYKKICELIKFANNVAGFGLSEEDVFQAINTGVMLNYYYYGGALFRRQRPALAQEGRSRPKPHELGASATGMMVSGQSVSAFRVLQTMNLSRPEPESALGMRTFIRPETYIFPQINNEFVKLLPTLYPAYPYYSLVNMLPDTMVTTKFEEAKDVDLAKTFFKGNKLFSVKLANRPVEFKNSKGVVTNKRTLNEVISDATNHFVLSQKQRVSDMESKIPNFAEKMKGASFKDSLARAFPKKTFESMKKNDLVGKTLKHRGISNVVHSEETINYQRKFDVGFDSKLVVTQNIFAYLVLHNGRICIERSRGGISTYETNWMPKFPIMQGVASLYLALQMIFGVSTIERQKQKPIFSTGHFSTDALTDEQIVGKVMQFPVPEEKFEAFSDMGFTAAETRINMLNLSKARLMVLNETVLKYGVTSAVPEINLSQHTLSGLLTEMELNFAYGLADEMSSESRKELRYIFREIATGLVFNDVTVGLHYQLRNGVQFHTLLSSSVPIRIGRVWEIAIESRII